MARTENPARRILPGSIARTSGIQDLVWATGYNLVAIPVAAGLLVPWGIDLPVAVGAIAMSLSTIIVAANAQMLRGLQLRFEPNPRPATVPSPA